MEEKTELAVRAEEQPEKKKPSRLKAFIARIRKPKPMYRRWWLIVLLLIFVPPVGIPLLWTQKKAWPMWLKIPLTVLSGAMLLWAVIVSADVTI